MTFLSVSLLVMLTLQPVACVGLDMDWTLFPFLSVILCCTLTKLFAVFLSNCARLRSACETVAILTNYPQILNTTKYVCLYVIVSVALYYYINTYDGGHILETKTKRLENNHTYIHMIFMYVLRNFSIHSLPFAKTHANSQFIRTYIEKLSLSQKQSQLPIANAKCLLNLLTFCRFFVSM